MFEDLRSNIELLETKENIAVEDLIDSMCRLFDDAGGTNRTVANIGTYGDKLVNLLDRVRCSYIQEADRLRSLNDEDIDEVIEFSNKVSGDLAAIQPVLENLIKEQKNYAKLRNRLKETEDQQKQLQDELDKLKNTSVEDIEKAKKQLEKELQERTKKVKMLDDIEKELKKIESEKKALSEQLEECKEKLEKGEAEKSELEKDVGEYDKWMKAVTERKEFLIEAKNAITVIKNAWKSIKTREESPLFLSSLGEFKHFKVNINSFYDLDQWFERTGNKIEKDIEVYSEMYRNTLEVLSKYEF